MKNKSMFFIGLFLTLVSVAGIFLLGMVLNPEPKMVAVALVDIEPGTYISELGAGTLEQQAFTGDNAVLSNYLTVEAYNALVADGGMIIEHVGAGEMIPLSVIMSAQNPVSSKYTDLVLNDPNMAAISVDASKAPKGVRAGDWVDIIVTISQVDDPKSTVEEEETSGNPFIADTDIEYDENGVRVTNEDLSNGEAASDGGEGEAVAEEDKGDTYIVPIAKTVVNNAYVLNVIRESREQSDISGGTTTVYGDITDFVIIVPRETLEFIMMAQEAGNLNFALLSPLAAEKEGPTVGATLKDLIEQFYKDRDELNPDLTPAPVSEPADAPAASQEPTRAVDLPVEGATPTPEVLPGS